MNVRPRKTPSVFATNTAILFWIALTSPVRARGAAGMFPRSCSRATTRQSRRGGWNNRSVARVCVGQIYLEAPPLSRKNSSGKC